MAPAAVVVRGERALDPAFVTIPLDLEDDGAITLFANLVTLTPGTAPVGDVLMAIQGV